MRTPFDPFRVCALVALSWGLAASTVEGGPLFMGIGDLSGGSTFSRVFAVSADGLVAVGHSRSTSGLEAFRWTASGGIGGLGDLPGDDFRSDASAVSADGSVVVGFSKSAQGTSGEAFRWENGVMEGLGDFPGGNFASGANAVSADGTVVAGFGVHATGNEASVWEQDAAPIPLGDLPGGIIASNALAMSASGAVIVGGSITENGPEAFRWTAETGMQGLGFLEGGGDISGALAVSNDGTVIAGFSDSDVATSAFLWTELAGMTRLADFFRPFALSDDASIIVGSFDQEALIWSVASGLRSLKELLETDHLLDLTGWTLERATGISADGRTIVGYGTNPLGDTEGWIVVVPEPSTLALLAFAAGVITRRRNPHKRQRSYRA